MCLPDEIPSTPGEGKALNTQAGMQTEFYTGPFLAVSTTSPNY